MTARIQFLTALLVALAATTAFAPPTVTNLNDSGSGSLREAIALAAPGETIDFSADLSGQTILLQGTHLLIGKDLTISAAALAAGITIDANNGSRHFEILNGKSLTLDSMILIKGRAVGSYPAGYGGSVHVAADATVTLNNCTLLDNFADKRGGAIFTFIGSSLTLNQCTLSNNSCPDIGGAIDIEGSASLTNCTITGNSALGTNGFNGNGGGIFTFEFPTVLTNCTIAGNSAALSGGGLKTQNGNLTITNSIIAGNTASQGADIGSFGTNFLLGGANLIGSNDSVVAAFPAGPLVGTAASPLDPRLSLLAHYGGFTMTMPPLATSPAIDASSSGLPVDQRGVPRPQRAAFDIGAAEAVFLAISASPGLIEVLIPHVPFPTHLQTAGALGAPWSTVLNPTNPQSYPMSAGSPPIYFRLVSGGPVESGQPGTDPARKH